MTRRALPVLSLAAVAALSLAGCASTPGDAAASGGDVSIVASTSVYADLAQAVVGDAAEVTAIIDSPTQDPHEYEASARDQLAVQGADLMILNGGGYDHFAEDLVEAAGIEHVVTVVEYNHDYPGADGDDHAHGESDEHAHEDEAEDHADDEHGEHEHTHIEGFNEHVWYDPHTIAHAVEAIAEEAEALLPDEAEAIHANAEELIGQIEDLEVGLDEIAAAHAGGTVFFTEPIGGYLAAAAGLEDVTTDGFAEAVEEGQDVAPATLLAATTAIEGGEVDVLVTNTQTAGPETEAVLAAAEAAGVPVVEYGETLPEGESYVAWMRANIDALADALG
ncbi:metal ABC transporter solute-binding protein, Zn/Mn family [Microbacterium sp. Marseille-Q6965]|uniref:metal ABC transporter solute-binding protein, Zn/Mn family n=1 Tax=Microbacterium sp. Marseille-Q6965 TaxID=2965072 RepID=UPI0021B81D80|nr:zinc ABC transporter substrate-binding protein [Microbacterium sp. Marseille-Q6965]